MILSNYWKLRKGIETITPYVYPRDGLGDIGIIDTSGNNRDTYLSADNSSGWNYAREAREFSYSMGALLSNGTDDYTINDYSLDDDITSSFTLDDLSINEVVKSEGGISRIITISGKNTSVNNLTITRVGFTKGLHTVESQTYYTALMAIIDLNTPLTVNAGGEFIIVAEWVEA